MDQLPQLISKKVNAFSTNIDETNTSNSNEELTSHHYPDDVRSATLSHLEKTTITDGNTSNIISEISLHSTDRVTLHNIGDKAASPSPFPNIVTKEVVEQRMPLIATSLKEMDIQSTGNRKIGDKKQAPEPRNINVNETNLPHCMHNPQLVHYHPWLLMIFPLKEH